MKPMLGITIDDQKQKPSIIKFYDFIKGGTDVMDMKIGRFSCKPLTHRWTMVHFYFLLVTTRCNALTLFAFKKGLHKIDSFDTCWQVVLSHYLSIEDQSMDFNLGSQQGANYIHFEGNKYHIVHFLSVQEGKVYNPLASRSERWKSHNYSNYFEKLASICSTEGSEEMVRIGDFGYFWELFGYLPNEGYKHGLVVRIYKKILKQSN